MSINIDVSPDVQEAMDIALIVDGGFTWNPRTNEFLRAGNGVGYIVAIPDTDMTIRNAFLPSDPDVFIGGWIDPNTNESVIELSQMVMDRERAIGLGIAREQYSIYDLNTGDEIILADYK